jgi:hypothetical protein
MRKTNQKVPSDRQLRRREWRLYAGDLKDYFAHWFLIRGEAYRIEGWVSRNPNYPIYVIRERDEMPCVMSIDEVSRDTIGFHVSRRTVSRRDLRKNPN